MYSPLPKVGEGLGVREMAKTSSILASPLTLTLSRLRERGLSLRFSQSLVDHFRDSLCFEQHLIVPDAQYLDPLRLEPFIPPAVVTSSFRMLAAIQLNGQLLLIAIEIENVSPDGMLASKLGACETPIADELP
jgi:hypothetical protein